MSDKKQIKKAARNVKRARTTKKQTKKSTNFWKRVWNIICWPFKKIGQLCRRIWKWLGGLDLICLANSALIIAIIVLFTMLIVDLVNCRRQQIVIIAETVPVVETSNTVAKTKMPTLPIAKNSKQTVNVVPVKKAEVEIVKKQTAKQGKKLTGDVIIDSRSTGAILQPGTQVHGNLYLQNMRKFVLPCDIRISGNLFLRDVNMLQFCGDFTVTGNIYVSPRSSFGPIPKTARVGGYVVL